MKKFLAIVGIAGIISYSSSIKITSKFIEGHFDDNEFYSADWSGQQRQEAADKAALLKKSIA